MALVTHTPGPWTVERIPDEAKRDPELTMDADGAFWIAEACMAGEVLAIVTALPKDADAAEANARLMALAPEMYEALHEISLLTDATIDDGDPAFIGSLRDLALALVQRLQVATQ